VIVRIFVSITLHTPLIFSASYYVTSFHIHQISYMIQRRIITNQLKSLHKLSVLLAEASIYSTDFSKCSQYLISRKPNKWDSMCSVETDGRMDGQMRQTNSRFS